MSSLKDKVLLHSVYTFPPRYYLENTTTFKMYRMEKDLKFCIIDNMYCQHKTSGHFFTWLQSNTAPSCCFQLISPGTTLVLTSNRLTQSSTCHIRHRWAMRQKAREEFRIGKGAGKRERLRESPIFLSMVFIKASSLIASVKVTGSFMSTWRVPALVCVAKQW